MKNLRSSFWPLLRLDLGIGLFPPLLLAFVFGYFLVCWVGMSALPVALLVRGCKGNIAAFFTAFGELLSSVPLWWLFIAGLLFFRTLYPALAEVSSPPDPQASNAEASFLAHEFLFSRAIDRRTIFRARQSAVLLIMLTPLFFTLLLWPRSCEVILGPDSNGGTLDLARAQQYQRTFGDGLTKAANPALPQGSLVIPNGGRLFAAWFLCWGFAGTFLAQAICSAMGRYVPPKRWLFYVLVGLPFILTWFLLSHPPACAGRLIEGSFLCFAAHPAAMVLGSLAFAAAIQVYCKREFLLLEVP